MKVFALATALFLVTSLSVAAVPPLDDATRQLARDIYKQLVETNTTDSVGSTTVAAEAMAARLRAAGFAAADVQVLGPDPRKGNLVARLRGSGKQKPLLLLAHLDVVEAPRTDWATDPFQLVEKDGYFYGRGTGDDKLMAAIWIASFIRFKQEHYVPNRDLIVALTADEEGGNFNGVSWLLEKHRDLIDAEYAINEGGSGVMRDGKYLYNLVGASEKVFVTFRVEAHDKGGHSSVPTKSNAIYELAHALNGIESHEFPVQLNEITRAFFARLGTIEEGQRGADMRALAANGDAAAIERLSAEPPMNARMRTTCVATMLSGGHAENALPMVAGATINCRLLPGEDPESVRAALVTAMNDPKMQISWISKAKPSMPSPLLPEMMKPIEQVTSEFWPGVPVVPQMATGASDGLFLRNAGIPTYGVSGNFSEVGDSRAHGRDERVRVQSFYEATQFLYTLVKRLSS
jgi:acetylornithine deacetylase/succinyl-diaminopimelate desuccinylase-like protein